MSTCNIIKLSLSKSTPPTTYQTRYIPNQQWIERHMKLKLKQIATQLAEGNKHPSVYPHTVCPLLYLPSSTWASRLDVELNESSAEFTSKRPNYTKFLLFAVCQSWPLTSFNSRNMQPPFRLTGVSDAPFSLPLQLVFALKVSQLVFYFLCEIINCESKKVRNQTSQFLYFALARVDLTK